MTRLGGAGLPLWRRHELRPLVAAVALAVAAAAALLVIFLVIVPRLNAPARAPALVPVATFDPWSTP